MTSIYLERRVPVRNQRRFYAIHVVETLFGSWAMVREWGRIGQPGTVREMGFDTEAAAIEAGAAVRRRKDKRGYRAVSRFSKAGGKGGE
jgi:predicted DNA-binding WGR domain protein